jgi:hypothetical protein
MTTANQALQRIASYEVALKPWIATGTDQLKRNWEFINTSVSNKAMYGSSGTAIVLITALAGGKIGAKIGSEAGKVLSKENGAKIGGGVGFAAGFTTGGSFGFYLYLNRTEKTESYNQWITIIKDGVIDNEFRKLHSEDSFLKDQKCPISFDFMIVPVRIPTGHLVDKVSLDQIQPDDKGRIKCPLSREPFYPHTAMNDVERALLIHKRVYDLLTIDVQNAQGKPEIFSVLQYRKNKVVALIQNFYNNVFEMIEHRRSSQQISFQGSQKEREEFVAIYGDSPMYQIDWNKDWNKILRERWIYFHPQIPVFDSNEV